MRFCKKMIFLFVVCAIAFMTFALNVSAASQVTGFAYNITTQFGEDASTEANINFFSNTDKAYIEYTLATDTAFANKIIVEGDKRQLGDDFKEDFDGDNIQDTRYQTITDYNYEVYLTELQPGTQYMYRVTDGSQYSDIFKFTTATGNSDSYTFVYINDPQLYSESGANAYYECLDLAQAKANDNGTPIQFVLGGGDMVESGGDAYFWNKLLSEELYKEVQYMAVAGNHEFTGLQSYLGKDGRFYSVSVNNPKNGCESYGEYKEVSCFYKYNDTLFVQLSSSGAQRKDQVEWVDKVLSENPAQFVIVNIHYPVVSTATDNVSEFIPVFDKYGVDLVLFGHTHTFDIQESYYNWKATTELGKGTYYMSMASSERSGVDEAIYSLITVSKDFIQVKNYNRKGAQLKSFSVKAKRTSTFELGEFDKETFKSSLSITPDFDDSSKATIKWDKSGYTNVKYVNVKNENGDVISSNFVYCDAISSAVLTGLEANKKYNFNIEVLYNDGSAEEVPYEFSTDVVYGELVDLEVSTTSSRYRLMYTPKFKSEVKSLKVYVNGKEVATPGLKDIRVLISLSDFTEGIVNIIEFKGVLEDGTEVLIYKTTYGEDASPNLEPIKEEAKAAVEKAVLELDAELYSEETLTALEVKAKEVLDSIAAAETEEAISKLVTDFADYIAQLPKLPVQDEPTEPAVPTEPVIPTEPADTLDKQEYIDQINAIIDGLKEEDFIAADWAEILNTKAESLVDIENATTEAELKAAVTVLELLVESLVESNAELKEAVEAAKKAVNDFIATLKQADYSEDNWKLIEEKKEAAIKEIEKVTKSEDAQKAVDALKTAVEAISKVEVKEEKSGCGKASSILFLSFMLLGLCLIRRKK